jgi:hypothetical protein
LFYLLFHLLPLLTNYVHVDWKKVPTMSTMMVNLCMAYRVKELVHRKPAQASKQQSTVVARRHLPTCSSPKAHKNNKEMIQYEK